MSTILDEIADKTKERVEASKMKTPLKTLRDLAEKKSSKNSDGFIFEKKLSEPDMTYICEVKKASPSKGLIEPDFHPVEIAKEYETAGAGAISVLTEPDYFLGSLSYLEDIRANVSIPLLRKDFTVDEYMIYEAALAGADVILLICAILDDERLRAYRQLSYELGLSAIVEAHDEYEIDRALKADAGIIGVNNRDLKDFSVDVSNGLRLIERVPEDIFFIAESGIKTHEDIEKLSSGRVNGVLIGETLMRAKDKKAMLDELRRG